ncbi:MAG: DUF2318 domain-containing protein [Oscillospiraceae bacterium]|nr:DUF2318 domain-containing protein [Oscillospiraceae bacterium]
MKKTTSHKNILLPVVAVLVVLAAAAAVLLPRLQDDEDSTVASVSEGDLLIQTADIGTEASYFDYDADGITVEVLAVLASDGTIRLALNTCQVCNGSPYAYFVQEGDDFICQNCMNRFSSTDVGVVSGGCNPVPITAEDYTEADGVITVPTSFLEENASRFVNWKQF